MRESEVEHTACVLNLLIMVSSVCSYSRTSALSCLFSFSKFWFSARTEALVFSSSALYASAVEYEIEVVVKSWKGNVLALGEFKIETAQGKTGARVESLGLENVRVRGM